MVSAFLVIGRIEIPQCIDTEIGQIHLLAVYGSALHQRILHGIRHVTQRGIPSQQGVLDLLLPLLDLGIRQPLLLLGQKRLIAL